MHTLCKEGFYFNKYFEIHLALRGMSGNTTESIYI